MAYNSSHDRMLVTLHRPKLWLIGLVVIIVLINILIWLAYVHGQRVAGYEKSQAVNYINELQLQLEESQSLYTESQRQTSMLERNNVIEDDTSQQLKKSLNESQAELLKLKKEVAFYKTIVSPENTRRSVAIQTIQLKPDLSGGYHYKIMISQKGLNDRFLKGTMAVTLEGSEDGQASSLKLTDISDKHKKQINFGMKYFQNFEGRLAIPVTFQPEYMRINIKPKTSKVEPVDEKFVWRDLITIGDENVGQQ